MAVQVPDDDFAKGTVKTGAEGLVEPMLQRRVDPLYSAAALRAKLQVDYDVQVVIDVTGRVEKARVVAGSVSAPIGVSVDAALAGLDRQAIAAVEQWSFSPGRVGGAPVPVSTVVHVRFRIH